MKCTLAALLLLLGLPVTAGAADVPQDEEDIERLEAWPEISSRERKQIQVEIQKLRKARTPEMAAGAEEVLVSGSAAAIPELLPVLAKERDKAALARVRRVLERMTSAAHTRVLALEFDHKEAAVRTWCLLRSASFTDAGLRQAAAEALARVRKKAKRADPEERYAAALCVVSTGSLEGFDVVREWASEHWAKRGHELRTALEAVRGPQAAALACELLSEDHSGDRRQIVAGLRLLSGCGDEASARRVAPYLDAEDNQIRVAAINAVRGIVDGDGPMEELSVFKAIEVAKMWKRRVGA